MSKPEIVIGENKDAGGNEDRVGELDDWEATQVQRVDAMAEEGERREGEREAVDDCEENLESDDGVDEAVEQSFGEDCVLFY